jgi:hypothetical protein
VPRSGSRENAIEQPPYPAGSFAPSAASQRFHLFFALVPARSANIVKGLGKGNPYWKMHSLALVPIRRYGVLIIASFLLLLLTKGWWPLAPR